MTICHNRGEIIAGYSAVNRRAKKLRVDSGQIIDIYLIVNRLTQNSS